MSAQICVAKSDFSQMRRSRSGLDYECKQCYHSSSDGVDVLFSKAQNSTDFPADRRSRVAKAENVEIQLPM